MRIVMVNDCAYVGTHEKTNNRHLLNKSVPLHLLTTPVTVNILPSLDIIGYVIVDGNMDNTLIERITNTMKQYGNLVSIFFSL